MKKVFYCGLGLLVSTLLTTPASAQRGGRGHGLTHASQSLGSDKDKNKNTHSMKASNHNRSNKGGTVRGKERAEEVQSMNKKADTNRGFTTASGVEKAETKTAASSKPSKSQ